MNVRELSQKEDWNNFDDLNAVHRPCKTEERVINFMKNLGLGNKT